MILTGKKVVEFLLPRLQQKIHIFPFVFTAYIFPFRDHHQWVSETYSGPKVIGSLAMRLGPKVRPSTEPGLNCELFILPL